MLGPEMGARLVAISAGAPGPRVRSGGAFRDCLRAREGGLDPARPRQVLHAPGRAPGRAVDAPGRGCPGARPRPGRRDAGHGRLQRRLARSQGRRGAAPRAGPRPRPRGPVPRRHDPRGFAGDAPCARGRALAARDGAGCRPGRESGPRDQRLRYGPVARPRAQPDPRQALPGGERAHLGEPAPHHPAGRPGHVEHQAPALLLQRHPRWPPSHGWAGELRRPAPSRPDRGPSTPPRPRSSPTWPTSRGSMPGRAGWP